MLKSGGDGRGGVWRFVRDSGAFKLALVRNCGLSTPSLGRTNGSIGYWCSPLGREAFIASLTPKNSKQNVNFSLFLFSLPALAPIFCFPVLRRPLWFIPFVDSRHPQHHVQASRLAEIAYSPMCFSCYLQVSLRVYTANLFIP